MILIKSGWTSATRLQHKINIKSDHLATTTKTIESIFKDHNVNGRVREIHVGPVVNTYEFEVENRTPKARVKQLESWLAKALFVPFIQITKPSGRSNRYFLEVPNRGQQRIHFSELVKHPVFQKVGDGALIFGVDAENEPVIIRLKDLPHLLIAGNNSPEKALLIHSLLSSLEKSEASSVRILLIDPKMTDFYGYKDHPHLLVPVVSDVVKAVLWIQWVEAEVAERLQHQAVRANSGKSRVKEKKKRLFGPPNLLIVINELADLMVEAGEVVTKAIKRIVRNGGQVGVHLIVGTQCPSETVVPEILRSDAVSQCAFQTASRSESVTILEKGGAEKLLGVGDGLLRLAGEGHVRRIFMPDLNNKSRKSG